MRHLPAQTMSDTHEVTNQPPPRGNRRLWADDPALRDHAAAAGADVIQTVTEEMVRGEKFASLVGEHD